MYVAYCEQSARLAARTNAQFLLQVQQERLEFLYLR
jgi:hypothetical protein